MFSYEVFHCFYSFIKILIMILKINVCNAIIKCNVIQLGQKCRLRLFANRILRRIFEPKRDEYGEWRRLHNEEINSLYLSYNVIRVIKSGRLRWADHVSRMQEYNKASKMLSHGISYSLYNTKVQDLFGVRLTTIRGTIVVRLFCYFERGT